LKEVFVEITWSDIANYLQRVKRQTRNPDEQVTIGEFVQYLDLLGLVDFLGFQPSDFSEKNDRKLNSYLAFVVQSRGEELQLQKYGNDWKLHFKDVLYENVWCDIDESGIWCGIVCGSGKMWRARSLREYILQKSNELRVVLEELQTDLGQKMQIVLRINSYFRHSRFRTAWLGNIGRAQVFPDGYEIFIKTFTNPQLNSFERLTKERINEVFWEEIEANTKRGLIQLDGQGRFPKWEDIPSFLQYCYFHIDVQLPSKSLIGKPVKDVTDILASVLKSLHKAVLKLSV
jgi:hypothetical protein